MKHFFCNLLLLTLMACSSSNHANEIEDLSWLVGEWESNNSERGYLTREIWWIEDGEMKGKGLVIKNGDTTLIENLSLKIQDNVLNYVAEVDHNSVPVSFKLTTSSGSSWTFENPNHDFPKTIKYSKTDKGFTALVSGEDRNFELNFIKK